MLIEEKEGGARIELKNPTQMPNASAFLWNKSTMIHVNCRGYAVAQFMQPEPAKYAYMPNLEAKTFIQPEQPFFAHHPGRFCYVKDEISGELFSAPYEPVRGHLDDYTFSVGKHDLIWTIRKAGIELEMKLTLPVNEPVEMWQIKVTNQSDSLRKLKIYPYFPVGYMSWMNQSGKFEQDLNAIVCTSITPYQKYKEYDRIKHFKDKTFLVADRTPDAYDVNQSVFEGEGGLHNPTGIQNGILANSDAIYETPTAVMQYNVELASDKSETFRFLFGAAKDEAEIGSLKNRLLDDSSAFDKAIAEYAQYVADGKSGFQINSSDKTFDTYVNHWLPRQIYYHGETNRLTTDPQTRNYLQDNMGMGYIKPAITKKAFVTALSQQASSGAMPDGILIHPDAELKYINQVPHTDHCVWVPICLKAYLDETNDFDFLNEELGYADGEEKTTVAEHIHRAMHWLAKNRDERGLNYINQGDWCDPMNMVGYKGKGVSGWLSMGTSYALQVWAGICEDIEAVDKAETFRIIAEEINESINTHLWDGNWYGRGITDDDVVFGISKDKEGRIFLNAQGWALLCNCVDEDKKERMLKSVDDLLETPYGVEMLSPAFTAMRDDVGRVTQKHPGSAENGSIYNHAAAFYVYALYEIGENDRAYRMLRKMIPGPDEADLLQRGQLPVFIPNYYRGAYHQFPRTAGRSSQLFNTGTVHWVYRCIIDGLLGLKGSSVGLSIDPKLPSDWNGVKVSRTLRGKSIDFEIVRDSSLISVEVSVDDIKIDGTELDMEEIQDGALVEVKVP